MQKCVTYCKNKFSKFLLLIALFFSFFVFAGNSGESSVEQKPNQTELILTGRNKDTKRTASFLKISLKNLVKNSFKTSEISERYALVSYNILINTKFKFIVGKSLSIVIPFQSFLAKIIANNRLQDIPLPFMN